MERTFPLHSPKIERIEVAARGDVRRAKLYYLRDRVGRASRVRERRWTGERDQLEAGAMPPDDEPRPGEDELAEAAAAVAAEEATAEGAPAGSAAAPQAAEAAADAEPAEAAADAEPADADEPDSADAEPAGDKQTADDSEAEPSDEKS